MGHARENWGFRTIHINFNSIIPFWYVFLFSSSFELLASPPLFASYPFVSCACWDTPTWSSLTLLGISLSLYQPSTMSGGQILIAPLSTSSFLPLLVKERNHWKPLSSSLGCSLAGSCGALALSDAPKYPGQVPHLPIIECCSNISWVSH